LPYSAKLVPFGFTPLSVFYATEAVSTLSTRIIEKADQDPKMARLAVAITQGIIEEGPYEHLIQLAHMEIAGMVECSEQAAGAFLVWLVEVSKSKPLLFRGFRVEPVNKDTIRLIPSPESPEDLFQRRKLSSVVGTR
jgi:hypothetical protein